MRRKKIAPMSGGVRSLEGGVALFVGSFGEGKSPGNLSESDGEALMDKLRDVTHNGGGEASVIVMETEEVLRAGRRNAERSQGRE